MQSGRDSQSWFVSRVASSLALNSQADDHHVMTAACWRGGDISESSCAARIVVHSVGMRWTLSDNHSSLLRKWQVSAW